MQLPSIELQQIKASSLSTETQLPKSVDGDTLPAIYPTGFTDLAANATTTAQSIARVALLHTKEADALFSISTGGSIAPFCPLPSNTLLIISVPVGQMIKASTTMRVVWL